MENKRENFNEEVSLEENSAKANNAEMAKKTILVVDDEKPIVDILTYNLGIVNHKLTKTQNSLKIFL